MLTLSCRRRAPPGLSIWAATACAGMSLPIPVPIVTAVLRQCECVTDGLSLPQPLIPRSRRRVQNCMRSNNLYPARITSNNTNLFLDPDD